MRILQIECIIMRLESMRNICEFPRNSNLIEYEIFEYSYGFGAANNALAKYVVEKSGKFAGYSITVIGCSVCLVQSYIVREY